MQARKQAFPKKLASMLSPISLKSGKQKVEDFKRSAGQSLNSTKRHKASEQSLQPTCPTAEQQGLKGKSARFVHSNSDLYIKMNSMISASSDSDLMSIGTSRQRNRLE